MNRLISKILTIILTAVCIETGAQTKIGGLVEFDRTVFDFGDIQSTQGPVSCQYHVKNISDSPITILNAISSCGCTDVKWTKESINPGESGYVSATYKNDEGAYPFDKTVTVYISRIKQPVILHLRGIVHEKALPIDEMYPVHFGNLGLRSTEIKCGNIIQGQQKGGEAKIANIGKEAVTISFTDVSEGLKLTLSESRIPAGGTVTLSYLVTPGSGDWGKCWFYATPLVNGKKYGANTVSKTEEKTAKGAEAIVADPNPELGNGKNRIGVWAFVKDDFSSMTREQRSSAANPMFKESSFTFGQVKAGTKVEASFECRNIGKEKLVIHKADSETSRIKVTKINDVKAGGKEDFKAVLDTEGLAPGEVTFIITLTTNSPLRPMVNLFINGYIK